MRWSLDGGRPALRRKPPQQRVWPRRPDRARQLPELVEHQCRKQRPATRVPEAAAGSMDVLPQRLVSLGRQRLHRELGASRRRAKRPLQLRRVGCLLRRRGWENASSEFHVLRTHRLLSPPKVRSGKVSSGVPMTTLGRYAKLSIATRNGHTTPSSAAHKVVVRSTSTLATRNVMSRGPGRARDSQPLPESNSACAAAAMRCDAIANRCFAPAG